MRVASYRKGAVLGFGVVVEGGPEDGRLVDATTMDPALTTVLDVLRAHALPRLAAWAQDRAPDVSLADVELLPPVLHPAKILCAGVNYVDHRNEAQVAAAPYPTIFSRFADSQVGHNAPLLCPPGSSALDWEGELVAVLGRTVYRETPATVGDAVVAWSCYDDATVRDWQFRTSQWLPGKNFLGTGGFGPWIVTAEEVGSERELRLETRLNGTVVQSACLEDLLFDVPTLISYVSTFTPLHAGDLVVTGTPSGVGFFRDPRRLLEPGDVVEVEISRIGTLRNPVELDTYRSTHQPPDLDRPGHSHSDPSTHGRTIPVTLQTSTADRAGATIPGATHHHVSVNGTDLHVVEAGSTGTPVLLVHGFPETWWAFSKLIPRLATRHRVIAVDLRGFGDSANGAGAYDSATSAQDLRCIVDSLQLGPVHLTGQDLSGPTTFRMAAGSPERVRSFTAIETSMTGFGLEELMDVTSGGSWHFGFFAAPGIADMVLRGHEREFLQSYAYDGFSAVQGAISPADVDEFVRTYSRPNGFRGASGLYGSMLSEGEDMKALGRRPLPMPVLAVGAQSSRGFGDFTRITMEQVANDVHAVLLPDSGHFVALEAPEQLADALLQFFANVDSRAR